MGSNLTARFQCLSDFEAAAREQLPHDVFEYVDAGAGDELTKRDNEEAFNRIKLRPRVLRDVSRLDTGLTLFGQTMPHPILLAPVAYQRLLHPEGEVAAARGGGAAGAVFVLGTSATARIEDCIAASDAPVWFLLYWQSDRGFNAELVSEMGRKGAKAICVTVDTPTPGDRRRQIKAGFTISDSLATPYFDDRNRGVIRVGAQQLRAMPTWSDITWLRSLTRLPLILKGILDPDDAEEAIAAGADAIAVSNHAARNLDTLPAAIDALPAIVERVAGRIPIIVDGGIRRGTDVLKSLALGASAVMIGRPYAYALAAAGSEGVAHCVNLLRQELEMAMAITGRARLSELDRSAIW
jgi:4-hydroxymandelate oxidase